MKKNYNIINAKYKLNQDEIDFLVLIIKHLDEEVVTISDARFDVKFMKKIISKSMDVSVVDTVMVLNFFSKIIFDIDSSRLEFELQSDIKDFFYKLRDDFDMEDIGVFFSLSSNYSRAIYKLLKTYEHKSKVRVNLEDLKSKLEVPKGFQTYSNFKMKVISTAQSELDEISDLSFEVKEIKDGKKVVSLVFKIKSKNELKISSLEDEQELMLVDVGVSAVKTKEMKNIKEYFDDDINDEIKRVVSFFDMERRKLQPNYIRKESSYNMSGEYLLRVHLKETGRTPAMFFDAIRWLFSNNPQAVFHRQYIMNIGKLIEHFNTLEHQAMYSQKAIEFNEEAQAWYNVLKKQGLTEEEIIKQLKDGGYIG